MQLKVDKQVEQCVPTVSIRNERFGETKPTMQMSMQMSASNYANSFQIGHFQVHLDSPSFRSNSVEKKLKN